MTSTISHDGINRGFQAGLIYGNIGSVTIGQTASLDQECLQALRTTDPHHDKERIKDSKGGLLEDCYRWILDHQAFKQWQNSHSNRLLWIRGDPGKGKTMLLCGVIEELSRLYGDSARISFFFCQATDTRINTATSVLRGLIYLLVKKHPSLLIHVRAQYDHAGKALFEDVNAWNALSTIFRSILKDTTLYPMQTTYLVIDALDECIDGLYPLLDLIIQESAENLQIKWVVSSRNWPEITERLDMCTATQLAPISLELNEVSISAAVNRFIQHRVQELAKAKKYSIKTRDAVERSLSSNSQGTFLWVALVCHSLGNIRTNVLKKLELFPPGLDALYERMIDKVRKSADVEACKEILAVMSTVFRPITLNELASFIKPLDDDGDNDNYALLKEIIAVCGSFLTIRQDTITFIHQSAKDFLLQKALHDILPSGIGAQHYIIFSLCLEEILKTLRRDILNIKLPGTPVKDICNPDPNPLAAVEYACIYWVDHLRGTKHNIAPEPSLSVYDKGRLDIFLQRKFLPWLEALSILGSVSHGIQAIYRLETLIEGTPSQDEEESERLLNRIRDASRFIRYYRTAIESSPLQVYCSPLIFGPLKSLTRISFQDERPDWVLNKPVELENWSSCLFTLEGHRDSVQSIAWSPDGSRLASASDDKTAKIWDPVTGQSTTLKGHSGYVRSVAWSPDGSRLASASDDKTARIWDPTTSQILSILQGHSGLVSSIVWSPDGTQLASGSVDKIARIWDLATGQSITLKGHSGWVTSVTWSPDGHRLVSGSEDKIIIVWDPATGQTISTLIGHDDSVRSVAWSPDGTQLASGSDDKTARIWDLATGQSITLKGHSGPVWSIAWSPDGRRLASASDDKTARIWDLATGQIISTLEGHSGSVNSVTWSPDGDQVASASIDKTARIWDLATSQSMSPLGYSASVSLAIWSPDGSQLASSAHKIARIWNPATGQSITLEGHCELVTSIAWSPDGSRLASASVDRTARIWDPATSQSITLEGHRYRVTSIAWSPDGHRLASGSFDKTARIWDLATGQSITLKGHTDWVTSIAWSPDGHRLASGSFDKTARIWDLATGQSITLKEHTDWVTSVAWSPDGRRLASVSDKTARIWDPDTGQSITLKGHTGWVTSIAWSQDGHRLVSGSMKDENVRIWDLATDQSVLSLHISFGGSVKFDKDDPNLLNTDFGTYDIGSIHPVTPMFDNLLLTLKQYGYGLSEEHLWVTYNGINLLWLPSEYRPNFPHLFARYASTLAIGCASGQVIFLALSQQNPISSL
ncbi:hypothetical protein N7454_004941 [Penicillium verhagenii]|nr:hypothetical protein N7454_004941 [Penicillium verhagenii]